MCKEFCIEAQIGAKCLSLSCSSIAYYIIFCKSLPYLISLRICRMKVNLRSPSRRQRFFKLLRSNLS